MTETRISPYNSNMSMKRATRRNHSFRLSQDGSALLTALARALGISKTAVVEVALRELGKRQKTKRGDVHGRA